MGLLQTIFGGSSQTSSSKNVNNPAVTSALTPLLGAGADGYSAIKALLSGDMGGFNTYKKNAGYDIASQMGADGIMAGAASRGLLRSGAAGKQLVTFGQQLSNQYLNDYFSRLMDTSKLGLGAAGVLSDSGRVSDQKSSSTPGLSGFLGGLFSGVAGG